MKRWLLLLLALSLVLTAGCGSLERAEVSREEGQTEPAPSREEEGQAASVSSPEDDEMFTERDRKTDYSGKKYVQIQLNGSSATASSDSVRIDGSTVTITGEDTYVLSGNLEGSIIVDAGEQAKPQLVLEGVDIRSSDTAALEIREADKVFVTLAEGTENVLSNGDSFSGESVDGALFSRQDLTLNGSGSLTVTSPAGHGIVCKDDLVFTGGSYLIQSAAHGLDANDSVRITGATALTLEAGKDGIHCENNDDSTLGFLYMDGGDLKITAEGDGISAGAYAAILDGSLDILAGGGSINGTKESSDFFGGFMGGGKPGYRQTAQTTAAEDSTSMKGLKADGDITVTGGSFTVDTADDAFHSNTAITVGGGSFQLKSGDDAFHAEETLTVASGVMNIETCYEGLEAHKVYVQGGDLEIYAKDDGINAAGGKDESGTAGGRDGMFGGERPGGGRPGGERPGGGQPGGHFGGGSSDGVIEISGGRLKIYASGDGLDANGSISVSDGSIYISNPASGDTSVMDSDTGATITGGSFVSTGASTMMAQSFDQASTQGVIACTVGSQAAGTTVTVTDAQGQTLVSYETAYDFVLVIISIPQLQKGETYTLQVGTTSGTVQAN